MPLEKKNFASPDEVRPMAGKGQIETVKPIAGTESCQATHLGYVISGHQKVALDNGTELELGPGDVFTIPPGHDGWVVGDEPLVMVDFAGMEHFAK